MKHKKHSSILLQRSFESPPPLAEALDVHLQKPCKQVQRLAAQSDRSGHTGDLFQRSSTQLSLVLLKHMVFIRDHLDGSPPDRDGIVQQCAPPST